MFNETLVNMLQSISDTRGFVMFCLVIAVAYASIWALFLFEATPKKKKSQQEAADKDGGEGDEADQRQQAKDKKAPAPQKQAA